MSWTRRTSSGRAVLALALLPALAGCRNPTDPTESSTGDGDVEPIVESACAVFVTKLLANEIATPIEAADGIVDACPASSSAWFFRYHLLTNAGLTERARVALEKAVELDADWSPDARAAANLRLQRVRNLDQAGVSEGAMQQTMALPGVDFDVGGGLVYSLPSWDHGGPTVPGKYDAHCVGMQVPDLFGRVVADFYVDPRCWQSSGVMNVHGGSSGGGGQITAGGGLTYQDLIYGPRAAPGSNSGGNPSGPAWGTIIYAAGTTGPTGATGPSGPTGAPGSSGSSVSVVNPLPLPAPTFFVIHKFTCDSNPNSPTQHECRSSDAAVEDKLQEIANVLQRNVVVTSGDRNGVPAGGAINSLHLDFRAADFHVQGLSLQDAFDEIRLRELIPANDFQLIWHGGENSQLPAHLHLGHFATTQQSRCYVEGNSSFGTGYVSVPCSVAPTSLPAAPQIGLMRTVLADPTRCGRHTSCSACTNDPTCGWCQATAACLEGTAGQSPLCVGGWTPFPTSCGDNCLRHDGCDSCTADECGWCRTNASCYSGTPAAPSAASGQCDSNAWVPTVDACSSGTSAMQEGALILVEASEFTDGC